MIMTSRITDLLMHSAKLMFVRMHRANGVYRFGHWTVGVRMGGTVGASLIYPCCPSAVHFKEAARFAILAGSDRPNYP